MRQVVPSLLVLVGLGGALLSAGVPDPDGLVESLAADRASERDRAAEALLTLGDAAEAALQRAREQSVDPAVRERADAILELLRSDPAAVERRRRVHALVAAVLRRPELTERADVHAEFEALHPEATDGLAEGVRRLSEQHLVPGELVLPLARHRTQHSVAALVTLLAEHRTPPSALLRLPARVEPVVGSDAYELTPLLLETLPELLDVETPAPYRRAAVALAGVLVADHDLDWFDRAVRDADPAVRAEAARALGRRRPARRASTLRELARHDAAAEVRVAALDALRGVSGRPEPGPAVASAEHPDPAVRAAAARLLGRDATPDTLGTLHTLARDPSRRVRAAATRALGTANSRFAAQEPCPSPPGSGERPPTEAR